MSDMAATWTPAHRRSAALRAGAVRTVDGQRLALGVTAAAVALVPLLAPRGPANAAPVDVLIGLSVAACLYWAGTSGHRWRLPYAIPMILFIAGGATGAIAGPVPLDGLMALVQDFVLIGWCWAVVNIASSPDRLRVLLATWAYSAIAWAVALLVALALGVSEITGQTANEGSRTALTFLDPNYSASYYVISIMIIWASGFPRRRGFRVAGYVALLTALATTGSNSGIVSLVVGISVAMLIGIHHRNGLVPAVAAFALMVPCGYALHSNVSLKGIQKAAHGSRYALVRDGIGRGGVSVAQRQMLVGESIELYERGGPLGQGPVSTKVRLRRDMAPFVKEAHDDYLAALLERGILGVIGLLLLVASLAVRVPHLARGRLAEGYAAVVVRPHALLGAVAGTAVAMAVYELLHVRHVWTLFAFVAALHMWGRR
jgi:hypothetical protein